jgi:hypothetical protein
MLMEFILNIKKICLLFLKKSVLKLMDRTVYNINPASTQLLLRSTDSHSAIRRKANKIWKQNTKKNLWAIP